MAMQVEYERPNDTGTTNTTTTAAVAVTTTRLLRVDQMYEM